MIEDLDTIARRIERANSDDATTLEVLLVVDDAARLLAEVRRLETALSEQSETVQREWLSPAEKEGWRQEIIRVERQRCLGIIESRMHTTDDDDTDVWSELDELRHRIESKEYGA